MQASKLRSPLMINLETLHYIMRSLEPADATTDWQAWMTDASAAGNLNARAQPVSKEQIEDYVSTFNRVTAHLLGIFEKETGQLVGIRAIYIDAAWREFLVNVLVGAKQARGKGARSETSDVMYRYFFKVLGLRSARCTVVATNQTILRVMDRDGWVHERTTSKPAASGQGFVELRHFRLRRDTWQRIESERARAL